MKQIFCKKNQLFILVIFLSFTAYNIFSFIFSNKGLFTEEFRPDIHRKLYGQSQYVLKNPISVIPDEIVYALAGWEYIHRVNPILINGEQPPLGKYLIGLSEIWFNNSRFTGPVFNVLILIVFFFLADLILESKMIASFLTFIFSFEKVFLAQIKYSPNLDNIQVFFILLTFFFFVKYFKTNKFLFIPATFISLGLIISTKFWITGLIIFISLTISLFLSKGLNGLKKFILVSPLSIIPLALSYWQSFASGMTIKEFFGTQKYIYSWHSGKLLFDPVSLWDFLFFNRWHFMGKIQNAVDWQFTWPAIGILSIIAIYLLVKKYNKKFIAKNPVYIIGVWFIIYFVLLSISTVNARYLFPVLPAMYILTGWVMKNLKVFKA